MVGQHMMPNGKMMKDSEMKKEAVKERSKKGSENKSENMAEMAKAAAKHMKSKKGVKQFVMQARAAMQ